MRIAQHLYEGVELGAEGPVGLITYMRTDSVRTAPDALQEVRRFIGERYGEKYLPEDAVQYRTKKGAQDAHEAIRPTVLDRPPETVAAFLSKEELALYTLIWNRFVASQMMPAVFDQTTVDMDRGQAVLRATGQIMKFPGYTRAYMEQETDDEAAEKAAEQDKLLPPLEVVEILMPEFLNDDLLGLDGLEVQYPGHVQAHRELMAQWAETYGLIQTGGSDCHDRANRPLGVAGVDAAGLNSLLSLLGEPAAFPAL